MSNHNANDKERTDHRRSTDPNPVPERDFTDAEQVFVKTIVQASNDAILGSDMTPYRAAAILRATADCIDSEGATATSVGDRLRAILENPGSYLPAAVVNRL